MAYLIRNRWYVRDAVFIGIVVLFGVSPFSVYPLEFYEKPAIRQRIENREIISVVKVRSHESIKNMEVLNMKTIGVISGISLSRAMDLMTDYENLEKIAPEYIQVSSLKGADGAYQKYLHLKTQIKTLLTTYKIETFVKIREERLEDRAIIHCEVVPAASLGLSLENEKFVGFKGEVIVEKYKSSPTTRGPGNQKGLYRVKHRENQLSVFFNGHFEDKNLSTLVPNLVLQFAMEVALQRVGILLRNYLEKTAPETKHLS